MFLKVLLGLLLSFSLLAKESLFEKSHYVPRKPRGFAAFSPDKRNAFYLDFQLDYHADAFFNTQGLVINMGTNAINLNNQNFALRNWIYLARPLIEVQIEEDIHFFATPDFGLQQFRFFDGYVDIDHFKTFGLLAGLQKSLVAGMEILENNINVNYAGYSSTLAPNREIGLMLHGALGASRPHPYNSMSYLGFDDWLSYQLGVFNGNADSSFPGIIPINVAEGANLYQFSTFNTGNKAFEGRLLMNPFIERQGHLLQNLGIGFAGSAQTVVNKLGLPAFLSPGRNVIFSFQTYESISIGQGVRNRIHPQFYWYFKNFGIEGDWAQTLQHLGLKFRSHVTGNLPTIRQLNNAGQIQFAYNLTGEDYKIGLIEPHRKFRLFDKLDFGALQLVFRLSLLDLDPSIFQSSYVNNVGQVQYDYSDPRVSVQRANTWTIALNWIWSEHFRMSSEFAHTSFKGGCSTGALSDPEHPGCLTASEEYVTAPSSQVINRPNELVMLQRFFLIF